MLKATNLAVTVDRTKLAEGVPSLCACRTWVCHLDLQSTRDTIRRLSHSDTRAFQSSKSDDYEAVVSCTAICCQDDKGQKVQTGQCRRPSKKPQAIPVMCAAELGHVTPLFGSLQSSRTSIAHNCNFKPQEETKLPQTFILLRKWTI